MKALFFDGALRLDKNARRPDPGPGEAIIRVWMAGICGTDMEVMKGYKGFRGIPGHEFVGVVEEAGPACPGLAGKRVVGEINCGCGACPYCAGGLEKHCPDRSAVGITGRDGVFAEYVALPERNLHEVPDCLADEEAVFTEPLAAAFEVMEQVHVRPAARVLILGDGCLGLLAALAMRGCGADVTLCGRYDAKLAVAAAEGVRTERADEIRKGRDYDIVVEATGSASGLEAALDFVRPAGTIVLKSTTAAKTEIDLSRVVVDEVVVVGSRCGPFAPAIDALASGRVRVKGLISAVYPLEEAVSAFEKAEQPDTIKVLLDLRK
jgi:2-desacetyl-2-hydroxyethyl bacteriochlorophyllide A dehydrogenase